jgi:Zn-dependent protease with chaperone function
MRPALVLFGYALAVAWGAPPLLFLLTRRGDSVRTGLAAWLAAMASVLASAVLALQFLFRTVAADWPSLTTALCHSVAGQACTPVVYRSALYETGVAALAGAVTIAATVALWRYGRRTQRARVRTRAHAEAAILAGRALPGTGAVVLDDPRPAAYCVAGRPAAIVLTSGALAVLDPPQLAAVLAHERAHLAYRHHLLATVTRGLAAAFPGVPLFQRGTAEVARLTEMAADDAAARASGRTTVVAALLAIGTGTAVPAAALAVPGILPGIMLGTVHGIPRAGLAAAAYAVPARVERMLRPARPVSDAAFGLALAAVLTLMVVAPSLLTALTG